MPLITERPGPGLVYACPNCDRAGQIIERERPGRVGDPDDDYGCVECRTSFDKPAVRREKKPGGPAWSRMCVNQDTIERVRESLGVTV